MAEIQTSTWSETAASNNSATPDGWPEGQTAASVNNCAREMMAVIKRQHNREHPTVTAGGTADALTLTYTVAAPAYATGMRLVFYAGASANTTTTPTVNLNGLGAKTIIRLNGGALAAGDIYPNSIVELIYDGTYFRLANVATYLTASTSGAGSFINGLQMRWGSGSVGGSGDTSVAYSSAFPNATFQVWAGLSYSAGSPPSVVAVATDSYTASGFSLGSSAACGYRYIAVGY